MSMYNSVQPNLYNLLVMVNLELDDAVVWSI